MHPQKGKHTTQSYETQLLLSQIEVQQSAYRHIAKELHDNVAQLLGTAKMLMGVTELELGYTPHALYAAGAALSAAIRELRTVSGSLNEGWPERFNFLENLQSEVARINSGEAITAGVDCRTAIGMKPEAQLILFRIVQEAIQNAVRHAQPSRLNVIINSGEGLEVRVVNDGKPLPQNFRGTGTANMRHRAQLFGGTVRWQSAGAETMVTINIPQNATHEN